MHYAVLKCLGNFVIMISIDIDHIASGAYYIVHFTMFNQKMEAYT